MDHPLTIIVPVDSGKLKPTEAQLATIHRYLETKKAVSVKLSRPVKPRSMKAHKYYWGVVLTTIASETGNDANDLHEVYKEMLIPKKFIHLGSREIEVRKTITDMSSAEFTEYIDRVIAHAATELGISVPPPN